MLYLVSTPIGNLKDITLRALDVLRNVDEIICESSKMALKLLNYYQIKKPLTHLSEENQGEKTRIILRKLKKGKKLALISDAGTPILSDPGQFLIKIALKENIKISPIPGASAVLSALICSGMPTQPFLFLGFLPKRRSEKEKIFNQIRKIKISKDYPTIVFYESTRRLIDTLEIAMRTSNDKAKISICREMTKIHEEFIRGSAGEILEKLKDRDNKIKGEITVVLKFDD
ncbi:MAG: 16S rRNA (cytidine(1402)-2'-O)-methyltransferase [Patescibacteria group bacterium]|nr:16S rRNA (cytidine(1402)-2'-O)-methyltransferase [Patescibacteria group bacterium]